MPPFAGDGVRPRNDFPINHNSPSDPGSQDDAEHHAGAFPRPVHRLRQREAVRVVLEPDRSTQGSFQVLLQRPAVEPGRVRVLHQPALARKRAGNPDTDGALPGFLCKIRYRGERRVIVAARSRDALAEYLEPGGIESERLDLGPAQIDADPALQNLICTPTLSTSTSVTGILPSPTSKYRCHSRRTPK